MITLEFKRKLEPLFLFNKHIILVDDCTYCRLDKSNKVTLPQGTFLLKVRVLPNYYSNTLLINEMDNGKSILIESYFSKFKYSAVFFIIWLMTLIAWILTKYELLILPLIAMSLLILGMQLYFSKYPDKALQIKIM